MKPLIICLSLAILFQTCGIVSSKDVRSEISGTYVAEWENEYTKAKDTIVLQWAKGTTRYDITRKTFSVQTISGKSLPGKLRYVQWVGIYDYDSKAIKVSNNGRILIVDPIQKILKMGSAVYRKIL